MTGGYKGLQGVTGGYKGLPRVTGCNKGLQWVTGGYNINIKNENVNEHLNASLHLNVQGTKLLAKNLISHLRNS